MSELPNPVRKVLRTELDELAMARLWRRIEARRHERRPARWRAGALAALGALAIATLVATVALTLDRTHRGLAPALPGAIALADGRDVGVLGVAADVAQSFVLSDGSLVALARGTRVEVLQNDGHALVALLASGEARFDVQPGGPRRWIIECGVAVVEVVGTRFAIVREASRVHVAVEHGVVLVRGDGVPDRVRKLTDGEAIDVAPAAEPPPSGGDSRARPVEPERRGDGRLASAPNRGAPSIRPDLADNGLRSNRSADWRELARQGHYDDAYTLLASKGFANAQDGGVAELLDAADVARLSGHASDAVAPLRRIMSTHAGDQRASLAAFTLGRVLLDSLDDAPDAAEALAKAIELGLPEGLREDAYARLVESRARSGDMLGAQRAAQGYHALFPNGSRAASIERWVRTP